jgi:hypothetical protein
MKRLVIKISSCLLAVILTMAGFSLSNFAIAKQLSEIDWTDWPDAVDYETALEAGLVRRDKFSESDLYSYVFDTLYGHKTQISYQYPVKYIDES